MLTYFHQERDLHLGMASLPINNALVLWYTCRMLLDYDQKSTSWEIVYSRARGRKHSHVPNGRLRRTTKEARTSQEAAICL